MSQLQAGRTQSDTSLRLMLRPSCMLCMEAEYVLSQAGITAFERVDIERGEDLERRYGRRIPVLKHPNGAELDWPFDMSEVQRFVEI